MRYFIHTVTVFFILLTASCTTVPVSDIQVETETAPGVDLSEYKTYAWVASAQVVFDPQGQWEPPNVDIDADVQFTINRQLRELGIQEVNYEPDLLVAYAAGVDMTILELQSHPEHETDMLTNVPKAALVVALIDSETGYVAWIGQAVGNISDNATEQQVRGRIEYAIEQMFSRISGTSSGSYGY